jgi:hypothetical protein
MTDAVRKTPDALPTREEINPTPGNLDEEWAVRHLLGKSLADLTALFLADENAAFQYQEDFMFMGAAAFRYYFPAYLAYFRSARSAGDSDTLNAVVGVLENRLQAEPETICAIAPTVLETLRLCEQDFDKFGADPEIYGDLPERIRWLEEAVRTLSKSLCSQ